MAKIKDEVFYMSGNKMKKGTIKGVSTHEGSVWSGSSKITVPDGQKTVIYTIGDYDTIESGQAFSTSEGLINSLLAQIDPIIS
jgi:hypothetical protein